MSEVLLVRPAAEQLFQIPGTKGDTFKLAFESADARLIKDSNNLVFAFEDGGRVEITDFYSNFGKDSMPDFVIDDQAVPGTDLFATLGADNIMPAADAGQAVPASVSPVGNGGRFSAYGVYDLQTGIGRLETLDRGMGEQSEDAPLFDPYGSEGNDVLFGDNGDALPLDFGTYTTVQLNAFADTYDTASNYGDDIILGGAGNDKLFGGAGNDFLDGGDGNDFLDGGDGNDIMVYSNGSSYDGGTGVDFLLYATGKELVDGVLNNSVKNVEAAITGEDKEFVMSLTSMEALNSVGINVGDTSVSVDTESGWTTFNNNDNGTLTSINNENHLELTMFNNDMDILAAQSMVLNT